jgi:hypothetical protein
MFANYFVAIKLCQEGSGGSSAVEGKKMNEKILGLSPHFQNTLFDFILGNKVLGYFKC